MRPSPECDPRTDTDPAVLRSAAEASMKAGEGGRDTATAVRDESESTHSSGFLGPGETAGTDALSAAKPAVRKVPRVSEAK